MMIAIISMLASCESSNEVEPTNPALQFDQELDLSDFIAVENVSKPVITKDLNYQLNVTVKLKVLKKLESDISNIRITKIDLCDENETTIEIADHHEEDITPQIIGAEQGKIVTVSLTTDDKFNFESDAEKTLNKIKKIRVHISAWGNLKKDDTLANNDDATDFSKDMASSSDAYTYATERLSEHDVADKSRWELEVMRNTIYARHGYRFKRDDLANHFQQFSWYHPVTGDAEAVWREFNATEQYNVTFIKSHEQTASKIVSEHDGIDVIETSGENWDEILDAYERYVNKLISYMEKIENGDMSAMSDYTNMMQEAERFSDKIKKAKASGLMSASQMERYQRILNKLLQASQKMQTR